VGSLDYNVYEEQLEREEEERKTLNKVAKDLKGDE